jgi:hypothetical protein
MDRKYLLAIILLTVNIIIYFFLLPYTQSTVNSHMSVGEIFSIFLYCIAISILFFVYTRIKYYYKKKPIEALILILIALSLIFWGVILRELFCEGCMNCG